MPPAGGGDSRKKGEGRRQNRLGCGKKKRKGRLLKRKGGVAPSCPQGVLPSVRFPCTHWALAPHCSPTTTPRQSLLRLGLATDRPAMWLEPLLPESDGPNPIWSSLIKSLPPFHVQTRKADTENFPGMRRPDGSGELIGGRGRRAR